MSERVLVCGGRNYQNAAAVNATLDALHAKVGIELVLQGGARGADYLAHDWASRHAVDVLTWWADWRLHGRAAGPLRNQRMLDEGKPTLAVAFPGGAGTADMMRRLRAANVEVIEVTADASTGATAVAVSGVGEANT